MNPSINPIKDALVELLKTNASSLGIKSVQQDFDLSAIVQDMEKLTPIFPAAAVVYYGRTAVVHGQVLETDPTFAIVLAHRSLAKPHAADPFVTELLDLVLPLIDNAKLCSAQAGYFYFVGDSVLHKDNIFTIYQMLFATQVLSTRKRS